MRSLEEIQAANAAEVAANADLRTKIEEDLARAKTLTIPRTLHQPDALFFREVWLTAGGETDDGVPFKAEVTRTVGGGAIVLEIDFEDGKTHRIIETLDMKNIVQAWLTEALKEAKTDAR